jgi:signal transduction histidine kinase/CheY-like chemotaxis protein
VSMKLITYALNVQSDVMGARQRARQIAELLGFEGRDQTRIATSVSEIARNAFRYAGGGSVQFELVGETAPQVLLVRVRDEGPGIANLDEVLEGTYRSTTGMGIGLIGSKRLMDQWEIHSEPGKGTTVTLGKLLPDGSAVLTPVEAGRLVSKLAALPQTTTLAEVQAQNAELLGTLAELQDKQDKLVELARELEDTNRGVVALYAELDEKATHLRRADELKTRFLSNMSHEFRTPLNSVRALSSMLLSGADGVLSDDQTTQVKFIAKAADDLSELVNDLLDLAKIEAGKIDVRPARFDVAELFSALRGMLRPLLVSDAVDLVFEAEEGLPPLFNDESKVSQILRNFISNALKFTERGTVIVRARLAEDGESALFEVADTGIGIAIEDMELIFEEFGQVPSALQRRVKGTGLGLPLCRKLAILLGGEVAVTSEPGRGSTFSARIPMRYREPAPAERAAAAHAVPLPTDGNWILVVEDEPGQRLLYEKFMRGTAFDVIGVATLAEAEDLLARARPAAVILDIFLPGEEQRTWRWLAQAKAQENAVPVVVVSAAEDRRKAMSLGADAYFDKPLERDALISTLERISARSATGLALIIDDDAAARYVIRRSLRRTLKFEEARDGPSGLALAVTCRPRVIFLDLSMPGMNGDEVLGRLKADPGTANIPVIIVTSHEVDEGLRDRLGSRVHAILQKKDLSMETLEHALEGIAGEARA